MNKCTRRQCPFIGVKSCEMEDCPYRTEYDWIPCSERLPEDVDVGEEFPIVIFCTSTTTYIGFYEYNRGRWWDSAYEEVVSDVIAWQPLPEPYEAS